MKHETMLREAIVGMFKPKARDKDEESLFWAMRRGVSTGFFRNSNDGSKHVH